MVQLTANADRLLRTARVGHLATASTEGRPHVIPVCFAFDGESVFSVLDRKPKSTAVTRLRRVRNILANPQVSLVVDHYEEDWQRLWYVLVLGRAGLLDSGDEWASAMELLREKYPQYREMDLSESPIIKIVPERFVPWSFLPE